MVSGVFDDAESIGDTLKETGSEYYWLPVTVNACGTCWGAENKLLWSLNLLWQLPLTNLKGIRIVTKMYEAVGDGVIVIKLHVCTKPGRLGDIHKCPGPVNIR